VSLWKLQMVMLHSFKNSDGMRLSKSHEAELLVCFKLQILLCNSNPTYGRNLPTLERVVFDELGGAELLRGCLRRVGGV
jgi:hypothetical protein